MGARGVGHIFIHDLMDTPGDLLYAQAETPGRERQRSPRRLKIKAHISTEEVAGVEVSQDQIGIGYSGLPPSLTVARRSRLGAGAFRPHLQQSKRIHARNATPTGPDLDHVDNRDLYRQPASASETVHPVHFELVRLQRMTALDRAEFSRRAAHIEREQIRTAGENALMGRSQSAGRRPGFQQAHRKAGCGFSRSDAAAGEHDEEAPHKAETVQALLQLFQVFRHALLHVNVGYGGTRALKLADLGHDFRTQ